MKQEYFMQVKTFEEEQKVGFLDDIVKALDGKAKYYASSDYKAYSSDSGISDSLDLSPITEFDSKEKKDATWYMFRITDYIETISEVEFDKLCGLMISTLASKIPLLASKII